MKSFNNILIIQEITFHNKFQIITIYTLNLLMIALIIK